MNRQRRQAALYLQLLKTSNPRERKVLLRGIENGCIKVLSEIVHNLLHGNVSLGSDKIHHLRKYKQTLQTLSKRSVPLDRKRTLLHQHVGGGFFPLLLPILSSVLAL